MRHAGRMAMAGRKAVELIAVVVAVTAGEPRVLTLRGGSVLPCGPFESEHRSLQLGVRAWVEQQTHHSLGYIEQLYTFADRDRSRTAGDARTISISYLGLSRETARSDGPASNWSDWYTYFPWEDQRSEVVGNARKPMGRGLREWTSSGADAGERRRRRQRVAITFGLSGHAWNEELVLQRYELLYEAGLVGEARSEGSPVTAPMPSGLPAGRSMAGDHRRILATAIARLRAKLKYRPVVFELLPDRFTLLQLQQTVEGITGRRVHKQNFRRLVEQQQLVEPTARTAADTRGRPARLFRFRRAVLAERAVIGSKLPLVQA